MGIRRNDYLTPAERNERSFRRMLVALVLSAITLFGASLFIAFHAIMKFW